MSKMDEIVGKYFALWRISALLDRGEISNEMSQPIKKNMLHYFISYNFLL